MRQRGEKRPHVSIASNVPSANMFLEENLQIQACSRLYFEASAQPFKLEHGTFKSYSIVSFCDAVRIIPTSIFATHPTDDVRKLIKKNKKKQQMLLDPLCLQKFCIWSQQQRSFGGQSCKYLTDYGLIYA